MPTKLVGIVVYTHEPGDLTKQKGPAASAGPALIESALTIKPYPMSYKLRISSIPPNFFCTFLCTLCCAMRCIVNVYGTKGLPRFVQSNLPAFSPHGFWVIITFSWVNTG